MPYAAGHRDAMRRKILKAARRELNRHGYAQTSIDGIMAEAGLTRGGFYSYFASKEDLLVQIIQDMTETPLPLSDEEGGRAGLKGGLDSFIDLYLSADHRDKVALGCSVPPLSPEISRADATVRDAFEGYANATCSKVAAQIQHPEEEARSAAIAILATCVGGLLLSRAVRDEALSDEILTACRAGAKKQAE